MSIVNRLFASDVAEVAIYADSEASSALTDLVSIFTNCRLSGDVSMAANRATGEFHKRPMPVEMAHSLEVGAVVDSAYSYPTLLDIVRSFGVGPFWIVIAFSVVSPVLRAQAVIESYSQTAELSGGQSQGGRLLFWEMPDVEAEES